MLGRTKRMSSIKVKGEDELGFFVSLWHKIKRFFGFSVMENFTDLMQCMTKYPSKDRCSLDYAV